MKVFDDSLEKPNGFIESFASLESSITTAQLEESLTREDSGEDTSLDDVPYVPNLTTSDADVLAQIKERGVVDVSTLSETQLADLLRAGLIEIDGRVELTEEGLVQAEAASRIEKAVEGTGNVEIGDLTDDEITEGIRNGLLSVVDGEIVRTQFDPEDEPDVSLESGVVTWFKRFMADRKTRKSHFSDAESYRFEKLRGRLKELRAELERCGPNIEDKKGFKLKMPAIIYLFSDAEHWINKTEKILGSQDDIREAIELVSGLKITDSGKVISALEPEFKKIFEGDFETASAKVIAAVNKVIDEDSTKFKGKVSFYVRGERFNYRAIGPLGGNYSLFYDDSDDNHRIVQFTGGVLKRGVTELERTVFMPIDKAKVEKMLDYIEFVLKQEATSIEIIKRANASYKILERIWEGHKKLTDESSDSARIRAAKKAFDAIVNLFIAHDHSTRWINNIASTSGQLASMVSYHCVQRLEKKD